MMPVHDWTRVDAGIFHAFHHRWISAISDALNQGILPPDYYALPEQHVAGFGPDVLTLQGSDQSAGDEAAEASGGGAKLAVAKPRLEPTAETDMEFYRRKQNVLVVRHVSGDRVVAMIEIVSPGNKSTRHAFRSLLERAAQLLENRVHLLLIDLSPPGRRDPHGLHAAVWEEIAGTEFISPPQKPLTVVAYESALSVRAYVRHLAVGDSLPEMPLFLEADACVMVPLEPTYQIAFAAQPARWRQVLETVDRTFKPHGP
jgi:hypothetical protein